MLYSGALGMMLSDAEIGQWYLENGVRVPRIWILGKKHFRFCMRDGHFVKLNHFKNSLTANDLQFYCWRFRPIHVYFSVLNWQFPERVSKKCMAPCSVPLNGEYVIDVDSHLMLFKHEHKVDDHWLVCEHCLGMAKTLTLQLCDIVKKYYSKVAVVFSGCAGFHVHVMDFNYWDWVQYHWHDPIWAHAAARHKFTRLLQKQTRVFDKAHFTVSVDPMRIVTVPNTVNGKTGLRCSFVGTPTDLELLSIPEMLERSKVFPVPSYPEPLDPFLNGREERVTWR